MDKFQLYGKENTGRFIIFSVITNIYNKKTKGPTLTELFTATGKLKKVCVCFFFLQLEMFDVCTAMTRHTSVRYSSSCHTRVKIDVSIFFTAAMIRVFGSARSRELHIFQEMIIGTLVNVNRNQAGACNLRPIIVVPLGCGMV